MASLATDSGITRDPIYYEDDGNVILRADSTVFKLALPQSDGAVDGQTDEQPIVLAGDTAEQFRSLLWALYARPDEIVKYLADSDNNERWMRVLYVAKLAHKYDCIDLAQWALDTVANHCRRADSIGSPEAVVTLVQLYSLRDHRPSLDEWAEAFIRRTAAAGGVEYLTLLRAAAASSWDEIEYHAYNCLVCGGATAWTALNLTSAETTRLLRGYHNLNEALLAHQTAPSYGASAAPGAFNTEA
ncbi:hypothetical protein EXIGLDRAFT_775064 [Exidia glandulosa HHB12029]|uniref:BTB domain-containing protein n=1 Tax=Exidia glandulosa HHB12029 TaxID=1314781 RepID=A0A165E2M2_EXIGL|nr:hypothetical protein EXIGLDRAFT_775064 [Exidia glandulosa HHB12029]